MLEYVASLDLQRTADGEGDLVRGHQLSGAAMCFIILLGVRDDLPASGAFEFYLRSIAWPPRVVARFECKLDGRGLEIDLIDRRMAAETQKRAKTNADPTPVFLVSPFKTPSSSSQVRQVAATTAEDAAMIIAEINASGPNDESWLYVENEATGERREVEISVERSWRARTSLVWRLAPPASADEDEAD